MVADGVDAAPVAAPPLPELPPATCEAGTQLPGTLALPVPVLVVPPVVGVEDEPLANGLLFAEFFAWVMSNVNVP